MNENAATIIGLFIIIFAGVIFVALIITIWYCPVKYFIVNNILLCVLCLVAVCIMVMMVMVFIYCLCPKNTDTLSYEEAEPPQCNQIDNIIRVKVIP